MLDEAPNYVSYDELIRVLNARPAKRGDYAEQSYYFNLLNDLKMLDLETKRRVKAKQS